MHRTHSPTVCQPADNTELHTVGKNERVCICACLCTYELKKIESAVKTKAVIPNWTIQYILIYTDTSAKLLYS